MFKILSLIWMIAIVMGQQFGQNKVQYKDFKWQYIQSKHFDIYFYPGGETISEFTAEVAESAYVKISRNWNYQLNKRISFFIYTSHNDFQQSLIVDSYLDEGIGGVTELYKNRIILPYEGDYKDFEHVIIHELVHGIMNDMLYGGSIQSLISRRVNQVPLWFAEGLAEWESSGWNTRLDMTVRDAVLNNTMPPIEYLQYYYPYQGGANVFKFISVRYGREKVGELMHRVKQNFYFSDAFESALGISFEKFTEEWHRYLKQSYWPEIKIREESQIFGSSLTNHSKDGSYLNSSPVLSPKGDVMAYLSNKGDGYISIYLYDMFEEKDIKRLVKGTNTHDFEELHFLTPGMSFSPDGKKLILAAKVGKDDQMYIIDIKSEDIERIAFDLDGIFDPDWSPDGKRIAFIGTKNGASDIYIYDLEDASLVNLTQDVFSDKNPTWSHDGKKIAFISDRKDKLSIGIKNYQYKMNLHNFQQKDLYLFHIEENYIQRITESSADESSPQFSPDDAVLAYLSDDNGISNIYLKNINQNLEAYPISNLLTGAFQMDWSNDGKQLVFNSYYKNGFDIFIIKNPLEMSSKKLENTDFIKNKDKEPLNWRLDDFVELSEKTDIIEQSGQSNYSNFNFTRIMRSGKYQNEDIPNKKFFEEDDFKQDGKYKVRDYDNKWSMDYVNAATSYDSFYGLNGFYYFLLSDMSGSERLAIYTNLVFSFRYTDVMIQYSYLPKRINYNFALFHFARQFQTINGIFDYRNYGASANASLPFNKFERLDLTLSFNKFALSNDLLSESSSYAYLSNLSYTYDNSKWYYFGPIDGMRYTFGVDYAAPIDKKSVSFISAKLDWRHYLELGSGFAFMNRFSGGSSIGLRKINGKRVGAEKFRLGGVDYWLFNEKYRSEAGKQVVEEPDITSADELSFSTFITPLRGAYYNEQSGRNFYLYNFEFRFPFIDYLILRVPPIPLQGIRGNFFFDIGSAFDDLEKFRGFKNGNPEDFVIGYGIGIQAYIPFIGGVFRFDTAWRDYGTSVSKPIYYFSFGSDL